MSTFVEKFGIDWKLMLAQLINFAIVFFLLKIFAYKPILKLLDKRREKIEAGLAFAEKAQAELASVETMKASELKQAREQSAVIVKQAEVAATQVRDEIVAGGEVEKQKLVQLGKALVGEQKARMEKEVYAGAVNLVEAALTKVLGKTEFKAAEKDLIAQTVSEIKV